MADGEFKTATGEQAQGRENQRGEGEGHDDAAHRLIGLFARHPTASNLLMALMLIAGFYSYNRLNVQFFPTFSLPVVTVNVPWPGASAEDAESNIIEALEPQLRFLDGLDEITSVAQEGVAAIVMKFVPGADMQKAQSDVQQAVDSITTLPEDAEKPVVNRKQRYERVANLSVSGPFPESAIRAYAKQLRDGMLNAGIDKVSITGLRAEEIVVELRDRDLLRLGLGVSDVAKVIREDSRDLPSGVLKGAVERQLRSVSKRQTPQAIANIEVRADKAGGKILLGQIADIRADYDDDALVGLKNGHPAIEMEVRRSLGSDTLKSLEILRAYLDEVRPTLPPTLKVQMYDVLGDNVVKRLGVLTKNGAQGLALVLVILFIFLNARIAFWVAAGIPVALMATFFVMYVTGQSMNMVTMFALIMMLGVIVDDAIVVGEHTATRQAMGDSRLLAAERGAGRMLTPVTAATLTTMASFLPMLMITGRFGDIMGVMPLVVMAVLMASLIECFFILPGHLRHGFGKVQRQPGRFRRWFDGGFERFRNGSFNRVAQLCYDWRYTTISLSLISLFVVMGLMAGGHIHVRRFPSPPPERLRLSVEFVVGTPRDRQLQALNRLEASLYRTEKRVVGKSGGFIVSSFTTLGKAARDKGDNLAEIEVQLTPSETRFPQGFGAWWSRVSGQSKAGGGMDLSARNFIRLWRRSRPKIAGVAHVVLSARRFGPGGSDVDIQLYGGSIRQLKRAAEALKPMLQAFPGVSAVEDDLPYGKPELVMRLTSRGRALGFTASSIGEQVRNAFQGAIATRFARGDEEVLVRVRRRQERSGLAALEQLYLRSPAGHSVLLAEVASISEKAGFSLIKHDDGLRIVSVTADLDSDIMEVPELVAQLDSQVMPKIMAEYGVQYRYSGAAEERNNNFKDMKLGAYMAMALIYIILAWVFGNYFKPLAVMAIIPFGVVGAVYGHLIMGAHLTMVSMIGILGLTGILVNDSIILVAAAKQRLEQGQRMNEAAVGAARDRLRAVVLTSATTIVGLVPLLFETSRQAQFLVPMAITMVFGLFASTILVLLLVPSLLGMGADIGRLFGALKGLYQSQAENGGRRRGLDGR